MRLHPRGPKPVFYVQETFLMDENLALKKGVNITVEASEHDWRGAGNGCRLTGPEAAGHHQAYNNRLKTAALCLLSGNGLVLPAPGTTATKRDEWVIIVGASGSVGQLAVRVRAGTLWDHLQSSTPSSSLTAHTHTQLASSFWLRKSSRSCSPSRSLSMYPQTPGIHMCVIFDTTDSTDSPPSVRTRPSATVCSLDEQLAEIEEGDHRQVLESLLLTPALGGPRPPSRQLTDISTQSDKSFSTVD